MEKRKIMSLGKKPHDLLKAYAKIHGFKLYWLLDYVVEKYFKSNKK